MGVSDIEKSPLLVKTPREPVAPPQKRPWLRFAIAILLTAAATLSAICSRSQECPAGWAHESESSSEDISSFNGLQGSALERALASRKAAPVFALPSDRPVDARRFSSLMHSNESVMIAMNLYNNEDAVPVDVLPRLISDYIGRTFVTIYENGSTDRTPEMLFELAARLYALGVGFRIHSGGRCEPRSWFHNWRKRVPGLARLRNKLLEPLFDKDVLLRYGGFETTLFLNDIFFTEAEVLEVLLQRKMQNAIVATASDWKVPGICHFSEWVTSKPTFYDSWVFRSMHTPSETDWVAPIFPSETKDYARWQADLPIAVFSSWSGMAAFSADVFRPPIDLRFRSIGETDEESECFNIFPDLWSKGLGRVVLASRARVAYTLETFERVRQDFSTIGPWTEAERVRFAADPPAHLFLYPFGSANAQWQAWDAFIHHEESH